MVKTQDEIKTPITHELTTPELAKLAKLSSAYIRQVILAGKLRATKRGRDWLISAFDAERWLEERRDAAAQ